MDKRFIISQELLDQITYGSKGKPKPKLVMPKAGKVKMAIKRLMNKKR
jgi:hypothetical protein